MNEEQLGKIQDNTLDWVSDWLNHDGGIMKLKDKLVRVLSPEDFDFLCNDVIGEVWCEIESTMAGAIIEWCENRYEELNE
tara:strand:- start:594 stop:833 length:240 start_codon:yes stop_codon:yes gene_type:complete